MAPRFLFSETLSPKEKSDKITLVNESRKTPKKNLKLSKFRGQSVILCINQEIG